MPRAEAGGAAALLGDRMVVAGGTAWQDGVKLWLRDVQVYDLRTDRWQAGPALPEPLAYGPFAQSETTLEIFGGTDGQTVSRRIWTLDQALGQWTTTGDAPGALLLGRAARTGKRVYLFGGCDDVADLTRCSDTVWARDDGANWRRIARLPNGPVALAAIAVRDGRIYLFGGCSMAGGKLANLADAWSFDPGANSWRRLRDLPAPVRGHTASAQGGHIYLFGGYTARAEEAAGKGPEFGFSAAVWRYDPDRDSYTAEAPMPAAMTSIEFFFARGRFWGAGGEDRMRGRSDRTFSATPGVR